MTAPARRRRSSARCARRSRSPTPPARGAPYTIDFFVPSLGIPTDLPAITRDGTFVDGCNVGRTDPPFSAPNAARERAVRRPVADRHHRRTGLTADGTSGVVIQGLAFTNFPARAVRLAGADSTRVAGNWFGLQRNGTFSLAEANGVAVSVTGKTSPADRGDGQHHRRARRRTPQTGLRHLLQHDRELLRRGDRPRRDAGERRHPRRRRTPATRTTARRSRATGSACVTPTGTAGPPPNGDRHQGRRRAGDADRRRPTRTTQRHRRQHGGRRPGHRGDRRRRCSAAASGSAPTATVRPERPMERAPPRRRVRARPASSRA